MTYMTNIPVGDAVLGRVIDASGAALDNRGPIDATLRLQVDRPETAAIAPLSNQLLETGIKVIDFFAPLVRGGCIALVAGAGVGKMVLIQELIQRVASRRGGCAVLASLDDDGFNKQEVIAELRSGGVEQYTATVLGRRDDPPGTAAKVAQLGLALAEDLCAQGHETLLFLDELLLTPELVDRLQARVCGVDNAGLTLFVLQHKTRLGDPNAALDRLLGECGPAVRLRGERQGAPAPCTPARGRAPGPQNARS